MKIIGNPEEKTIPVGYVTYPEKKLPVGAKTGINWEKYIPWVIVGLITHALVSPKESKK